MESAGVEDMPEDAERKGIGTPATRADIIESLVSREFVYRKEKLILPIDNGYSLVKILPDNDPVKSPLLTAEWESDLKKIERGELTANAFMDTISSYVREVVAANKDSSCITDENRALFPQRVQAGSGAGTEVLGKCPRCGGDVTESTKAFSCVRSRDKACGFVLFKDSKFFTAKKKTITKHIAKALLSKGRVAMKGLHSEKTGKPYDAVVCLIVARGMLGSGWSSAGSRVKAIADVDSGKLGDYVGVSSLKPYIDAVLIPGELVGLYKVYHAKHPHYAGAFLLMSKGV